MFLRIYSAAVLMFTPRNPAWERERNLYLKHESVCQWCGGIEKLQVHHTFPVHSFPDLEMVKKHWITLCMGPEECHYRQGHRGKSWLAYDPDIRRKCEEHRRAA